MRRGSLLGGGTYLGSWMFLREPIAGRLSFSLGYDYSCIDMQHGTSDLRDVQLMLSQLAGRSAVNLVRVPGGDPSTIGQVLDFGASGVIVPMVNTAEQAQAVVAACRYAPEGIRSFGPLQATLLLGMDYFTRASSQVLCIPMIETSEAVANLPEILAVPGIDAIYVGPSDLALSLGFDPQEGARTPAVREVLVEIAARATEANVMPGVHSDAASAVLRRDDGYRMITISSDWQAMATSLRSDLQSVREANGHGSHPPVASDVAASSAYQ